MELGLTHEDRNARVTGGGGGGGGGGRRTRARRDDRGIGVRRRRQEAFDAVERGGGVHDAQAGERGRPHLLPPLAAMMMLTEPVIFDDNLCE